MFLNSTSYFLIRLLQLYLLSPTNLAELNEPIIERLYEVIVSAVGLNSIYLLHVLDEPMLNEANCKLNQLVLFPGFIPLNIPSKCHLLFRYHSLSTYSSGSEGHASPEPAVPRTSQQSGTLRAAGIALSGQERCQAPMHVAGWRPGYAPGCPALSSRVGAGA